MVIQKSCLNLAEKCLKPVKVLGETNVLQTNPVRKIKGSKIYPLEADTVNFGTKTANSLKSSILEEESLPVVFKTISSKPEKLYVTKDMVSVSSTGLHIPDITMNEVKISDNFKDVIKTFHKRNSDDITTEFITDFINITLNDKNFKNADDVVRYLKNLKVLFSKKAPDGNYILRGDDCRFLADFTRRNLSKENIQNINDLIHCVEDGYLPSSIFKHKKYPWLQSEFSNININLMDDIAKIKTAKQKGLSSIDVFIPKYKRYIDMMKDLKQMKPGEMVSCEGFPNKVYMKSLGRDEIHEFDIDRETIMKVFPPVERFFVAQGDSGTCYQLASYISQLSNTKQLAQLLHCIEKRGNDIIVHLPYGTTGKENIFAGKFADFAKNGTISTVLKDGEFVAKDAEKSVISNPLIKALEHLYGKHRKYTKAHEYIQQLKISGADYKKAYQEALQNMDKYVYITNKSTGKIRRTTLDDINAGNKIKAFEEYKKTGIMPKFETFMNVEDYYKPSGTSDELFRFMYDYGECENLSTLCKTDNTTLQAIRDKLLTPNAGKKFSSKHIDMKGKPIVENYLITEKSLFGNHAYSIVGYDSKTDIVQYINPWNSAFVFEMPLKNLAKYIDFIAVSKRI